ncbi:MAG: histidine phosphatase family protein [Anaerolineae bacterium]|nr:histidine phosphatase family protein [Anaerolineae bacterium]
MTIIHVVRHGNVHNPDNILYGRLPNFRLSDEGEQQAAAAGAYLQDRPLQAVISSPQLRARQTAAHIAGPHGLAVEVSPLLDEIVSPHQGRPISELDAEGWIMYENLPEGYETPADITARLLRQIEQIRARFPDGEVAIVSHGDVVIAARFWAEGVTFNDDHKNAVPVYPATASITTLAFSGNGAKPALTYHQPY